MTKSNSSSFSIKRSSGDFLSLQQNQVHFGYEMFFSEKLNQHTTLLHLLCIADCLLVGKVNPLSVVHQHVGNARYIWQLL